MSRPCAHRGLSAEVSENTVAAFQAAVDAGFTAVEMDLRMSHDGEVVVLHDATLDRTTDGKGRVSELAYDEIRGHPTLHGPVPRLDDVFQAMKDWDGLFDLELKVARSAPAVVGLVEHHGREEDCVITSMDPRALEGVDLATGLIVLTALDDDWLAELRRLGCAWAMVRQDTLTADHVLRLHDEAIRVGAWTVNAPERAADLVRMGVDLIITDTRDILAVH